MLLFVVCQWYSDSDSQERWKNMIKSILSLDDRLEDGGCGIEPALEVVCLLGLHLFCQEGR